MKKTLTKLIKNLKISVRGLWKGCEEHSFRIELYLGVLLLPLMLLVDGSGLIKLLIVVSYLVLLAFELMNTAIEAICDRITRDFDEEIKNIKDISSAAVFVLVVLNMIVLLTFFLSKLSWF